MDVWRKFHPNDPMYTRVQKNPFVCSRLDYIIISSDLLNNVRGTNIVRGIDSDHNIVDLTLSLEESSRGKGFWKLNLLLFGK